MRLLTSSTRLPFITYPAACSRFDSGRLLPHQLTSERLRRRLQYGIQPLTKKYWPLATCPKSSRSYALKVLGRATFERLNYSSRLEAGKCGERRDNAQRPTVGYSRPFSACLGSSDASLALLFISSFSFIVASEENVLPIFKRWPQLSRGATCSHFSMLRKTTTSRFAKTPGPRF